MCILYKNNSIQQIKVILSFPQNSSAFFAGTPKQTRQKEPNDFEALQAREVQGSTGGGKVGGKCSPHKTEKWWLLWGDFGFFCGKKKRGVFHLEPEPPFFWQNHSEEFDSRISHKWIACYYQAGEVSLLVDLMSWQFTNIQTIILKPS